MASPNRRLLLLSHSVQHSSVARTVSVVSRISYAAPLAAATRRSQYRRRTGRELTDDNVWIHERRREIASLDAIIERLRTDLATAEDGNSVGGAGTANRLPLMQIKTRGSHESVLRKADPGTPR
jgi:hypothetical protein